MLIKNVGSHCSFGKSTCQGRSSSFQDCLTQSSKRTEEETEPRSCFGVASAGTSSFAGQTEIKSHLRNHKTTPLTTIMQEAEWISSDSNICIIRQAVLRRYLVKYGNPVDVQSVRKISLKDKSSQGGDQQRTPNTTMQNASRLVSASLVVLSSPSLGLLRLLKIPL